MRYDVIIAGAGPAGCAAAYDLARAGRRVLLVDRRQFPRAKACAGGLTMKTLQRLRYSVAPVIREVCSEVAVASPSGTNARLRARTPVCALVVRSEFDEFCLKRTVAAGAEFQVISHIRTVDESAGEVVLETSDGSLRGEYLVGADGSDSVIRRLRPGFSGVTRGFAIEAQVPLPDTPGMRFDLGTVDAGYGWVFPKGDHANVGLYTSSPDIRPGRDALASYARARCGAGELRHVIGHHVGLGGWVGPLATGRVALVGDAAGLADPLLGEGIYSAVASGQAAAEAILCARSTGQALSDLYARALRPLVRDLRTLTLGAARVSGNVERAHRMLSSRVAGALVMAGFARGTRASVMWHWLPFLPLLPLRPVPWLPVAGVPRGHDGLASVAGADTC